ncbi:MAG: metal ABC transporter substrate-binding protein [Verrucomicrobiota bacterium]
MKFVRSIILPLLVGAATAAEIKVSSLHPLLGDLTRNVGGERVEVIDLLGKDSDPHSFEPDPAQLKKAADSDFFIASGMGLESYLDSLRTILPKSTPIVVLGDDLPSIEGSCSTCDGHDHGDHDHSHHDHGVDPHWWHSIDTFRRAVNLTADALIKADPDGEKTYRANALAYRGKLDELERWTRREIARIPKERRILATAHAAFGYFCKDYGFEAIPVSGLNREQMPDPRTLSKLIEKLRADKVAAIFPEDISNPKTLEALTEDTGITLAPPLIADGTTADSYEAMIRHNVTTIVEALK